MPFIIDFHDRFDTMYVRVLTGRPAARRAPDCTALYQQCVYTQLYTPHLGVHTPYTVQLCSCTKFNTKFSYVYSMVYTQYARNCTRVQCTLCVCVLHTAVDTTQLCVY